VLLVEAMKMENSATEPRTGIVALLRVAAGDSTPQDAILCVLA
jgi:biotin carboxyl carrier protein